MTMDYAIVEIQGKQYKVTPGKSIEVDNLSHAEGEAIEFDKVLLYVSDGEVKIGVPYIEGIKLSATVVGKLKGKKVRVAKFLAKSRHRRVGGFRHHLSKVQIADTREKKVAASSEKAEKAVAPKRSTKTKK